MARQPKRGLDYFSHDTDLFNDPKIKVIKAKHGLIGYAVYLRLLELIYNEHGYYIPIDDDFNILFVDDNNISIDAYMNVLNDCINRDLFNKKLYDKYCILTSARIQKNYLAATERRSSVDMISEYILVNDDILRDNVNINSLNDDTGTQSKEKKRKEEKTELEKTLDDFYVMRNKIKKPMTDRAKTQLINKLNGMASTDSEKIAILEQSIFNSWQGIFELKSSEQFASKPKLNIVQSNIKEYKP